MVTGGQIVAEMLDKHGIDRIFCVAGESYLPVLDVLLDFPHIQVVTCRHESGATFMAESYARLTGKAGVALVTRAPGACNSSIGIHAARQSSTPVILFVGLINTMNRERESFQEFDMKAMFGAIAKSASVIDRTERIADYIAHGFQIATNGRNGPVVLGLPEEVLTNEIDVSTANNIRPLRQPVPKSILKPDSVQMEAVVDLLSKAERPIVLVGGSLWDDNTCKKFEALSGKLNLPVVCSLRRQDLFNHNNKNYIGEIGFGPNPALVERFKTADTVLVLGTRIDEITAQDYTLFQPEQKIIHVYHDPLEFGRIYTPNIAVQSYVAPFIDTLEQNALQTRQEWASWCEDGRNAYETWTSMPEKRTFAWNGADMTQIFRHLRDVLPEDAVIASDAGNFSGWAHRYLRFGRPNRALAPVSGAMGYAVPAALAGAFAHPERISLGICGDGGFMMTANELATAVHHGIAPIFMVCNNAMYGTIRMHQNRDYAGRPHEQKQGGTALTNPDFAAFAQSFGAFGIRIEHEDDFLDGWDQALKAKAEGRPALLEIVMDPRQLTTNSTL